ncbi:hypothetical protein [Mucilaginibacter myungsuensis]|uniref:Uncharacterized protein n=1 Tax=Mucilaginibacter myungsuensis TaxID=649104 RepID=A0A929PXP2_9SPHI|nr:hypothetical protein [Mucilaginibacter myungsuensis]MBE9663381.1 hypothetical protein [Mucilaginibacter myungsuensis]MDN3600118.1 hypothetical protein [Mucilaginibacter myungsuensis]
MISDEAFNEAFKPLHIPSAYHATDSWRDKIAFALAEIEAGTADDVAIELLRLDPALDKTEVDRQTQSILKTLFDSGLIKGTKLHHGVLYNLSKILVPNSGSTHPGR